MPEVRSVLAAVPTGLLVAGAAVAGPGPGPIADPAVGWDRLWEEMLIDITVIGLAFAAVAAWFMWRYRRRDRAEGDPPRLSATAAVGWAVIPAFVFMADDFYLAAKGWELWKVYRTVPEGALEVRLDSAMWSWNYTYPNGAVTVNELRVPAGRPVLLRMTSRDVVHSHFIPDFRVKEDSMPGRITYLWFYPKEPGEHVVTCAEYCGLLHSRMAGKVIVMAPDAFDAWYRAAGQKAAAEAAPGGEEA